MQEIFIAWIVLQLFTVGIYCADVTWRRDNGEQLKADDGVVTLQFAILIGAVCPLLTILFFIRGGGQEVE